MVSWKLHEKWAKRLGVPKEVSRKVNEIIDFGEEGHDRALKDPEVWATQFWRLDEEGKRAFYLHLLLDEMKRVVKKYKIEKGWDAAKCAIDCVYFKCGHWSPRVREIVVPVEKFLMENAKEIIKDIKKEIGK